MKKMIKKIIDFITFDPDCQFCGGEVKFWNYTRAFCVDCGREDERTPDFAKLKRLTEQSK